MLTIYKWVDLFIITFVSYQKEKKDLCHVKSEKISNEEVKLYRLRHINKGILYGKFFLRKPHEFLAT